MECLKEIIGIVSGPCECLKEGLEEAEIAALGVSQSGLYLTDLEGGVNMNAIKDADSCKNFAEMSMAARDTAIKKLYADILVALGTKYKAGKNPFIGNIGRPSYAMTMDVSQRYQFMKLKPKEVSDAMMKITGLRIIVDRAATLPVKIMSTIDGGNQGTEIMSVDVETGANVYTSVPLPGNALTVPLSENGQPIEYYVMWDRGVAGLAQPKDMKIDCNCGAFGTGFKDYFHVSGGELANPEMLSVSTKDGYSHGFTMDVEVRCVPGNLVCREYDRENAIALTMAWATMYKAGELLIEAIMSSNEVNRYTMMNREYLWGKRSHFKKEYETRILYLSSVMDVTSSDCFICRDTHMFMAGIQS